MRCWGKNEFGQLGDGTMVDRLQPVAVAGLEGVLRVEAGMYHSCAVTDDDQVHCWGRGESGQLGDGALEQSPTPVAVAGLEQPVSALSLGDYHSCALLRSGQVHCWGANDRGQAGTGVTSVHTSAVRSRLNENTKAVAIATGGFHTCALLEDATISCWGQLILPEPGGEHYEERQVLLPETVPGVP